MKSKLLSLLLALMLAVTMTPMFAFAAEEEEEPAAEQETTAEQESAAEQETSSDQVKLRAMSDEEETFTITDLDVKLSKTSFVYSTREDLEQQIYFALTYDDSSAWYGEPEFDVRLDSTNAGSRKVTVTSPYYEGSVVLPVTIKPLVINSKNYDKNVVHITNDSYTYNGKAKKPKYCNLEYVDKDDSYHDIPASQYTITYTYKNNVKIGKAKVTGVIKFKGNYAGTITESESFYICPKPTKIKKITRGKTTLRIKWKKVKKTISGYYVTVHDADSVGGFYKSKRVSKNKTSCRFTGLKRHHDYEVTVLTYKKVKGKNYYQWQSKGTIRIVTTK